MRNGNGGSAMVRLLGRLVPPADRDGWIREWEAELEHDRRTGAGRLRRAGRLAAAAEDALRLRMRRLGPSRSSRSAPGLPDVRFAVRTLARSPGFTATVVLTLALGVGANAGLFTVLNAVMLEPLPYPAGERLVQVRSVEGGEILGTVATADFDDLRERLGSLEDLGLRVGGTATWQGEVPVRLDAAWVSSGFFRLFGTRPHLGRYFLPEDDEPGGEPKVVLSHGLWQRVFGGDPSVVRRTVALEGRPYTVVGVAQPGFTDPGGDAELWFSRPGWIEMAGRKLPWLQVWGRVAPRAALSDVRTELETLAGELAREHPETNADRSFAADPIRERLAEPLRPALLVLLATVGLVLLLTCANVASLVLVRAAGRERELAVRISLGAGRARLAGQLLTEGLLLALLGGAAGLGLAAGAVRAFVALGAPGLPRLVVPEVDGAVLAFTLLVSAGTGVVVGLVPLVQVSAADPSNGLRQGGRGGQGRRVRRLRRALVAGELAVSAMLLVGAGLMLRSLLHLGRVDVGVRTERVLTLHVAPPEASFATSADLRAFYDGLRSEIVRLPGVEAVGGASLLPLMSMTMYGFSRDDAPPPPGEEPPRAELRVVEPGFFRALGIPLLRGRVPHEGDAADAPPAVVVDEALVRRFFAPDEDPLGRRLTIHWGAGTDEPSYEIVGVVASVRHLGPTSPAPPTIYTLRGHDAVPYWQNRAQWLVVRTDGEPADLAPTVTGLVWGIDRTIPVTEVGAYQRFTERHLAGPRYQALLIGFFALLATLLASVGVAGVVGYMVAQREHEIGLRQALGARAGDVVGMVMGEGVRLAGAGIVVGLLGAAMGSRLLESLLFGVAPGDPATYGGVGLVLAAVALGAAWIPARRASRVQPSEALRREV